MPRRPFTGKINVDVRDSVPDWEPYMPPRAPEGSPNILIVLYDDTGMAAWEPFGGRIRMPTLERLAEGGLRYSQWHTTALCSPTRSCMLTGRNHHQNGMACIVEGATGYPGSNAHLPKECGTVARGPARQRLEHLLGRQGPLRPAGGGQPGRPEVQLAAAAGLRSLLRLHRRRDQPVVSDARRGQPLDRPALHARRGLPPVQGPRRPGAADDPRQSVLLAVAALVHVVLPGRQPRARTTFRPSGPTSTRASSTTATRPTATGPWRAWSRRACCPRAPTSRRSTRCPRGPTARWTTCARGTRSQTTRSGSSHGWPRSSPASPSTPTTRSGGSSTTSRSPASSTTRSSCTAPTTAPRARGRPTGRSTRTSSSTAGPTRWRPTSSTSRTSAAPTPTTTTRPAGRSPSRRRSRCSSATRYAGGTCDPLVIHWPAGSRPRARCATSTTTSPTSSRPSWTVAGSSSPTSRRRRPGAAAGRVDALLVRRGRRADAAQRQYYCMLGTRGIWQEGWKAVAVHGPTSGIGHFDDDQWELFHVDEDRAEANDLAAEHPDKLKQLIEVWFEEAEQVRRAAARRPPPVGDPQRRAAAGRAATATRTSTTRTPPRCPRRRRPTSAGARSRSSPRSRSRAPTPRA